MRDLVTAILQRPKPTNLAPVPYVGRRSGGLAAVLGGGAGSSRTQQLEAMGSVGTLFAIVARLSEATASATWHLYRRRKDGADPDTPRVEVTRHAALDLWRKPNEFYTNQLFVESVQQPYELVGEGPMVVVRAGRAGAGVPIELWPVRPDRLEPVPHPQKYLSGWIYTGPDGETIPLAVGQVMMLRRPNPLDPYRGMGPVQTLLTDIDASKYSAEWNRNFFKNSAEPGGIVEVPTRLTDDEFTEMRDRWQEQHQGVSNAHRVAILEQAKWVDRKYTMRDMQFRELRDVPRELIREAFGFPKPLLGTVDDVNRANSESAEAIFGSWLIRPRLARWRDVLNEHLLPMYGPAGQGLEFDFDDPVPANAESERADFDSKVAAAVALIAAGFDRVDVLTQLGLPDIAVAATPEPAPEPEPPAPAPEPAPEEEEDDEAEDDGPANARRWGVHWHDHHEPHPLNQADDERDAWMDALDALLDAWRRVTGQWRDALLEQIRQLVRAGNLAGLPGIAAPTDDADETLHSAMTALAAVAVAEAVAEAAEQDVALDAPEVDGARVGEVARTTVALLAAEYATSAAREALRVAVPGSGGEVEANRVTTAVAEHLDGLTDARPREWLGGALTSAEAAGREAVFAEAELAVPTIAFYADEVKDRSTCKSCAQVDGKWLGNTLSDVMLTYPTGGYIRCEGRIRCRGRVKAVYRPEQRP